MISNNMRREHKSQIDSVKTDFFKIMKEIDKIDQQIKQERLFEKTVDEDFDNSKDKNKFLAKKLDNQNNDLTKALLLSKETETNIKNTTKEIVRQNNIISNTNTKVDDIQKTLSLQDQIFGVMRNRELGNKIKLISIIALLFVANLLVLYLKFSK